MSRRALPCLLALGLLALAACAEPPADDRVVVTVSAEQAGAWIRNFNPVIAPGLARWPTRHGIYEPLEIWNPLSSRWTPWLATAHQWSDDLRTLRFSLRRGVRWSDGAPMTARDVVFTYELLREHPALDLGGIWSFLDRVRADGDHAVELRLRRPYALGLADLAHQLIVPAHIWSEVADPLAFTNPNPVATGPFTEVRVFRNQVYELGANPDYWGGIGGIDALRMPALPSNDQVELALIDGTLDWASVFIPKVEQTYVARDPEHHRYWFPPLDTVVMLYPNARRAPLDDPRVRRALSMAIDRRRLTRVAMEGYASPTDGSPLSECYAAWKSEGPPGALAIHDVAAANRLLDEAGLARGADGLRRRADGAPLDLALQVVSGWSDWVRAAQLIARDLAAVGVRVHVRVYEFGAWYSTMQRGDFDLSIAWTLNGPTPHRAYRWLMSSETVSPLGEPAQGNWNRVGDPEADLLLRTLETTVGLDEQRALVAALQARFEALAPAIPLFPTPVWGTFSTRHAVGFPSADDPFARLGPHLEPDRLLVLTRLRPAADRDDD